MPGAGLEAGDEIAHGRHLRQRLRACRGGHRQRAHLAGLDMRHRRGAGLDRHLDLPADQVGHHRRAALVGHVHDIDARHRAEHLAREMLGAAGPLHSGKFSWEKTARLTLGLYHRLA